jgi:hypothetical protein
MYTKFLSAKHKKKGTGEGEKVRIILKCIFNSKVPDCKMDSTGSA